MWKLAILSTAALVGFFIVEQVHTCNEAVCGSIVSKCLLTQQCKCDLKNCTCCKDCFTCLSLLYEECCSCVDMCPKPNETENISKKSHVEDLAEPVPGLFNVLTEYPDPQKRWNSTTFPVDVDITQYGSKKDLKIYMHTAEQEVLPTKPNVIPINCTVAFMSKCMSWLKCKTTCQSMGATRYRWFHDGCCECIGNNCLSYGIGESRCRECPLRDELDDSDLDVDEEDYDYGQEDSEEVDQQLR